MLADFTATIPLAHGLHARPATALRQFTRNLPVTITLHHPRTGRSARSVDVLALVALDARHGDTCRVVVDGADATRHAGAVERWFTEVLPACDAPAPAVSTVGKVHLGSVLPRLLAESATTWWSGRPVSPGIGEGLLVTFTGGLPLELPVHHAGSPREESAAFLAACDAVIRQLTNSLGPTATREEQDIVAAHEAMLEDGAWRQHIATAIANGHSAAQAVLETARANATTFSTSGNAYLAARAGDVQDLARQLLARLPGGVPLASAPVLTVPSVILAEDLTPSDFLALDRLLTAGLVLRHGAATGHTAILARSFGIPCVIGAPVTATSGISVLVDGDRGLVVAAPEPAVARYYAQERQGLARRRQRELALASRPATTRDGQTVAVEANIAAGNETVLAIATGSDGVGLFRTEMLFLGRDTPPGEDEQEASYRSAAVSGKPITIRLLDVGGDKQIPWLDLPAEDNPFLGCRGVRLYARHPGLIRTQIRAILRAAIHGDLRIMIPMVTAQAEIALVRDMISEAAAALATEGVPHRADLPVGIMVEVPVACLHLPVLARHADFLCVGTNDLAQYLFAADRGNPLVNDPANEAHPAFLATLARIVGDARTAGRPVVICGEMAGRRELLPLLVGLGVHGLSVAPPRVASLKAAIAALDGRRCRDLLDRCLDLADAAEVQRELAAQPAGTLTAPLINESLVLLDVDARSKEDALKIIVEHLHGCGRTAEPRIIEDALWAREAISSTGLGHGCAIPHCQSRALAASTLVVARFRTPVEWQSLDQDPVHTAVLIAMRPDDQGGTAHLAVFSRLARRYMSEKFRDDLVAAATPQAVLTVLEQQVLRDVPPAIAL